MLKDYCYESDNTTNLFVGIKFVDGVPRVIFPHGYRIPSDDKECRKDIFRLIAILQRFTEHNEGDNTSKENDLITKMPISSYQYLIQDFLSHGYYTEKEIRYIQSLRGKINWKRTIQQEQAQIDGDNVVYLNFQVKTNQTNTDNLISHIHKFCVYQSFYRFGWLYFSYDYLPEKPQIKFNKKLFLNVLYDALNNTFNDAKRKLFQSMINIVLDQDEEVELESLAIGVNRFDPIWERMIDFVFGEEDKEKYFPHATWHIIKMGKIEKSSALEPDTIMKLDDKIYVLDAKYYKYGVTGWTSDLPATSSIQKQITYGKRIAEQMNLVDSANVYNAFIMPFASTDDTKLKFVSVGTADWEEYSCDTLNYAYVLGILLDTKWLVSSYSKHNESEIEILADLIEKSLVEYRAMVGQPLKQ